MKFEDYLIEKHCQQYSGTKDCMIDDFDEWLQDLGVDTIIEYAEKWYKNNENVKLIEDIYSKSFSDNNGNYICLIPKELMRKIHMAIAKSAFKEKEIPVTEKWDRESGDSIIGG